MRWILGSLSVLVFATAIIAANSGKPKQTSAQEPLTKQGDDKFIVHEWGTFTSFSGSDGVKLEFRPLVDVDLPPFVVNRARQSGVPNPFSKINLSVLQRMETPVTYFYSDRARQANVRVGFPQGLLTEFFPPVESMTPEFNWKKPEPLTNSSLDWGRVWIIPENQLRPNVDDAELADQLHARMLARLLPSGYSSDPWLSPYASANDHYADARETDSALVYVERPIDKKKPVAPSGAFFEKFLFYRGVGNFDLPLELTAASGERFELKNSGEQPIRSLFLVSVDDGHIRFAQYPEIRGGETLTLAQSNMEASVEALSEAVLESLISEGLYEKEARAMVKTWQSSWFGEQGTRLFYMLPQTDTDKLLPLQIDPQPEQTIRVMVGRMEIMTPEDEARILSIVQRSVKERAEWAKANADKPQEEIQPYALAEEIVNLGRLAEPALIRVQNIATEDSLQYEATSLLYALREYRNQLAAAAEADFADPDVDETEVEFKAE